MKKKVLFALIALFSCVSTWAANFEAVTVGDYTVDLSSKMVLLNANNEATAPTLVAPGNASPVSKGTTEITGAAIKGVFSYNAESQALTAVTTLNKVGNYFLQVSFSEVVGGVTTVKTIYVPFTVGKEIPQWWVFNKTTWDAALGEGGFLASYYGDYPEFELWDGEQQKQIFPEHETAAAMVTDPSGRYTHDFRAQLSSMANYKAHATDPTKDGAHPFPYLGFTLTDAGKHRVIVSRPEKADFAWSTNFYGDAEGARKRSFISLATEGSFLNSLGVENGNGYAKFNDYTGYGISIDDRQTLGSGNEVVANPNFGKAYKWVGEGTERKLMDGSDDAHSPRAWASTIFEAVQDPSLLNGMQLIAIPEEDAAQLAASAVILSTDNTTVTVTPKGADSPITATSEYTYPGVGVDTNGRGNFTVTVVHNGVTLVEGVDYNIAWAPVANGNKFEDAGTWPIVITGAGIYTTRIEDPQGGSPLQNDITVNYKVKPAPATPKDAKLTAVDVEYNGTDTDDSAEEVAMISYKTEGATPTTVTESVEDLYNDRNRPGGAVDVRYVYVGATEPAAGTITEGLPEVDEIDHVGFWEMRVYFAPATGAANYTAGYVSDIFEVTPTQLAMHLGIINWPFGKDYPEVNKLYYSIAKSEYAPGDGTNNVKIEGLGVVWPYEQIGSQQSEVPVGSPVGSYRWNLAPGAEALAVTTIGGVDYVNYYVVVHNDNAIINIGKSGLIIGVNEEDQSKIYGYEDPETFRPVINNANNEYVQIYPIPEANVRKFPLKGTDYDYTSAAWAAQWNADKQAAYDEEAAEMARIYAGVTITRKGGKGDTPRLEDVNAATTDYKDGYPFTATLSPALAETYTVTKTVGAFFILPYDITPREAVAAVPAAESATGVAVPAQPAYTADKFDISVPNVTYNGTFQKPAVSVVFHHAVLGDIPLYAGDDPTTTAVVEQKSYDVAEGAYSNNKNVVRNETDWKVKANQATVQVNAGSKTEWNPNIYGVKSGTFTVNPATLTVELNNTDKIYGESDPANLLECTITGFVTVGEGVTAKTEDPNDKTLDATEVGKYYGVYVTPTVTRVKKGTPEGEVVGKYAIIAEGGKATNYNFDDNAAGQLEIKKAKLTVSANPFRLELVPGVGGAADTYVRKTDFTFGDHIYFDVIATGYKRNPMLPQDQIDANLLGEAEGDDDVYDPQDKSQDPAYGKITISSQNAGAFTWAFTNQNGTPELENYTVEYVGNGGEIAPNQDGLWLTIEPKSKTYGTADPELTYIVTLDGEEIDLEDLLLPEEELDDIVLARDPGSNAGKYNIKFTEGPATVGNYVVNYDNESGKKAFTINKATLFVKATVVYPQKVDKDGKPVVAGGKPVYETSIPFGQEIGLAYKNQIPGYAIVEFKNHISTESGVAGSTVTGSGLIEGDDFDAVINEKIFDKDGNVGGTHSVNDFVEYTCDYEDEANVGKFTVSADGPEAKNYIISYNDGVNALEVVAAELALKAKNQTIAYNDLVEFDADGNGKYNTPAIETDVETWVQIIGAPVLPGGLHISDLVESISCDETSVGVHAGAIKIKPKNTNLVEVEYQDGTLTVNPLDEIHLAYENVEQALEDHKGQEVDVYLPARQMKADRWYTFVLPFSFNVPELSNQLYYGVVDVLNESKNDKDFHFDLTIGEVEANQPFLFKVAEDPKFPADDNGGYAVTKERMQNVVFHGVEIADVEEGGQEFAYNDADFRPFRADEAGHTFTGIYVTKDDFTDLDRVMSTSKETGKWQFNKAPKGAELGATYAYISYPSAEAAADSRIIIEEANGVQTIIEAVETEADAEFAEGWYTVTGVKLDAKPTEKGVYIYNGKKVSIQ